MMQNEDTLPPVSTVGVMINSGDPNSHTTSETGATSTSASSSNNNHHEPPMSDISESAVTAREGTNEGLPVLHETQQQEEDNDQQERRELPTFKHQVQEFRVDGRRVSQTTSGGVPLVCAELLSMDDDRNDNDDDDHSPPRHNNEQENHVIEIAEAQIDTTGRGAAMLNGSVLPPPMHAAKERLRRLPKGSILGMILIAALTIVGAAVGGFCAKGRCTSSSNNSSPREIVGESSSSGIPTVSPTGSPTVPLPPTPRPTVDLERAMEVVSLVTDVTLETDFTATYPIGNATTTSLENAVSWLVEDSSVYLDLSTDSDRLVQRYALAALYHHIVVTTGNEGELSTEELRATWLKGDECEWYEVYCLEGTHIVEKIKLDNDQLKGNIPLDIGLLTSLTSLDLDGNALRGRAPTTIGRLVNLTRLELQNNDFFGTVPTEIGELSLLTHLDLSLNIFNQELPSELSTLTALQGLYIDRNRFTGTLPPALESLTKLREFWLHDNDFKGNVPAGYAQWTDLNYAFFQNNVLTGDMPFCVESFVFQADNGDRMIADCGEIACDCCTHCCPQEFNGIPQSGACA